MNPAHRQAYLAALEIPSFVRRDQPVPDDVLADSLDECANEVIPVVTQQEANAPARDMAQLRAAVQSCTACALSESRTQTVFGVGNENANLLIIGEAPGAEEDRQGEPFVGTAGQLLNGMLKALGLAREQVYIANILKCRPPGNRNPAVGEVAACRHFLLRQVELIQPKVILSLGGVSAHNLLQTDDPVARLRLRKHTFGEQQVPLLVTYHPAYLLRRTEEKAKVWQDIQQLVAYL